MQRVCQRLQQRLLLLAAGASAAASAAPGPCWLAASAATAGQWQQLHPAASLLQPLQLQPSALAMRQQQQQQQQCRHHSHHAAAAGRLEMHGTTVLCVRKDDQVVLIADGQISAGPKVVKPNARKLRRLATEPAPSLGGFAGSTADGLALFDRLEQRLEAHPGQLRRAAVELAKMWRQDRVLRHLEAVMIVADAGTCLEVSGKGELLEPADGVHAVGSGARHAIAAARALLPTGLAPLELARRAMAIAAEKCIYTNSHLFWEVIRADGTLESGSSRDGTILQ